MTVEPISFGHVMEIGKVRRRIFRGRDHFVPLELRGLCQRDGGRKCRVESVGIEDRCKGAPSASKNNPHTPLKRRVNSVFFMEVRAAGEKKKKRKDGFDDF